MRTVTLMDARAGTILEKFVGIVEENPVKTEVRGAKQQ
jgi:hypothetical protein